MRIRSTHSGFTLLELVLVMLVIAVAAAMVAPSLRGSVSGRRLGDAATQLVSLAQYARTQAVTQGRSYRLNVDVSARTYWLTSREYDVFQNLTNDFGRVISVPDGVGIECDIQRQDDGTYVEFRPSGRTDPATIRLRDDNNKVLVVACDSATELFHTVTP
jgi:type II secretion system protein H